MEGLAFSSNGTRLATSDGARTQVRNAASGAELLTVRHTDYVLSVMNSVAFSPDGTRLATGSDDKTARITAVQTPPSLSLSH